MAEKITIARPYAKAVFELARDAHQLARWSESLTGLAAAVRVPLVAALIAAPEVGDDARAGVIIEICADALDEQGRNFVRLLSEKGRLDCLAEIASEYAALRAAAEAVVDVELTAPVEVDAELCSEVQTALQRRLGREVRLHCAIDESLLGGAVIRAGDLVIDASVRGRLDRLATAMSH